MYQLSALGSDGNFVAQAIMGVSSVRTREIGKIVWLR